MNELFKFAFEQFTDPLCLPIDPWYEWAVLGVIGLIAYLVAYSKVGDLYHTGMVSGRTSGSFFHWVIRVAVFVALWFVVNCVLHAYFFIKGNWQFILIITASVVGTVLICILAVFMMRFISKRRRINTNA